MAKKKIIAVTGATGAQAGGLARAILDDPSGEFALRAVTRDPRKDAARALADRGAEVVQADLDNEASLRSAFDGAYGVYCLTNFWEHFNGEKETRQGGNLARAAAAAGVQHAIWSTFEDTRKSIPLHDDRMPTLQEKYKVVHFDAKADADHFFTEAGVPTTFLLTSFYWENFIFFGLGPKRGEDGVLAVTYPMGDKKLPTSPSRTSATAPTGSSSVAGSWSARPSVSRASTRPARRSPPPSRERWARRCATTTCRPTSSGALTSPAPTTSGTCSSSRPTSTTSTAPTAASSFRAC